MPECKPGRKRNFPAFKPGKNCHHFAMLNWIWLGLIVISVAVAGWSGELKAVSDGAFNATKLAVVDLAIPLIGMMTLWLGMMRLAERAGLVQALARLLRPIMLRLFPQVPAEHPAMGSMVMNMAANMLGLGNAATPLGLKAMKDLQTLNIHPGVATNAMCMFLAINTSSIQILPISTMNYLFAAGSRNPESIISTALLATLCSTIVAIVAAKLFERFGSKQSAFAKEASAPSQEDSLPVNPGANEDAARPPRLTTAQRGRVAVVALLLAGGGAFFLLRMVHPEWFGFPAPVEGEAVPSPFRRWMEGISLVALPLVLCGIPLLAAAAGVKVYEEFVEGAKEGVDVALRVVPFLVGILVAVGMFREARCFDALSQLLAPALGAIGFPPELLPLSLIRPLSGSGANAVFVDLIKSDSLAAAGGPDSLIARMAATIIGSTETTFYVLAVYFGSVGVRKTRHALPCGLLADATGIVASIIICRAVFAAAG